MKNKEIGRIGQCRYGGVFYEEFLPELRGRRGVEAFHEMSDNDDIVGAILFSIEMLVKQAEWNIEPAGSTAKDQEAAEFVETVQDRQGFYVSCIEEIAWRRGFIDDEQLYNLGEELKMTDYGKYLLSLLEE